MPRRPLSRLRSKTNRQRDARLLAVTSAECRYERDLEAIFLGIQAAFLAELEPFFADVALGDIRKDSRVSKHGLKIDEFGDALILETKRHVQEPFDRMSTSVNKSNERAAETLLRVKPSDLGIDHQIDAAREASIQLVEKAGREYAANVREVFGDPANMGLTVKELKEKLYALGDISKRHAAFIARDQTLKLNGAINQIRMKNAGITKYIWSTSKDERVRESHAELEGEVFDFSAPPEPGNPGEDFQCRCVAVPYIEELDGPIEEIPVQEPEPSHEPEQAPEEKPEDIEPPVLDEPVVVTPLRASVEDLPVEKRQPVDDKARATTAKAFTKAVREGNYDALRGTQRSYLERYGMTSRDVTRNTPGHRSMVLSDYIDGADAVHHWDGSIEVRREALTWSDSGLEKVAAGRYSEVTAVEKYSTRVMFHEELHGMSTFTPGVYKGAGAGIEEAATEILARRATRDLYKAEGELFSNTSLAIPKTIPLVETRPYDRAVGVLVQATTTALGVDVEAAVPQLEEALMSTRQGHHTSTVSPRDHAERIADALKLEGEKRGSFVQTLLASRHMRVLEI
jgi:SPP1 gp7 family putative phage head morphogenesis protein